jgi:thiol-disulfide isomerase/thioredoxin
MGKPIVLSFWASWCGPCRKELPALAELAGKRPGVTFLAINVDKDRPLAEHFIRELKLALPVAYDPEASVMAKFDVVVMPTMFMVDQNGTVKFRKTGFSTENGLTELIAALDAK